MTTFNSTFDTASPAGADDPSEADDRMREIKAAVQERLAVDHKFSLTGTEVSATDTGEHIKITFNVTLVDPTQVAGKAHLYMKGDELFYQDDTNTAIKLTSGGKLGAAGTDLLANTILTSSFITIPNNNSYRGKNAAGADRVLIFINDSDQIILGSTANHDTRLTNAVAGGDDDRHLADKGYVDAQLIAVPPTQDGSAKGWATHNSSGVLQGTGFNITSVVRNAIGDYTITWATDFADTNYAVSINSHTSTDEGTFCSIKTKLAGSVRYTVTNRAGSNLDFACDVIAHGTQ